MKTTSSGNAEIYARQKMKARTGGEEGMTPVTTAGPEDLLGQYLLSWKGKSDDQEKKEKKVHSTGPAFCPFKTPLRDRHFSRSYLCFGLIFCY